MAFVGGLVCQSCCTLALSCVLFYGHILARRLAQSMGLMARRGHRMLPGASLTRGPADGLVGIRSFKFRSLIGFEPGFLAR